MAQDDATTTVKMQHFENVEVLPKNGAKKKCLKADEIANFISNIFAKIVYHRNQLKYYRNIIAIFTESFDASFVVIDFSENLSVPVKFEPQSLHWSHEQVTVHSGITKACSEKNYHVHLTYGKKHDQFFVHLALTNMINNAKALDHS